MLTVFMRYRSTRGGRRDLRTDGRAFDHKVHSSIRWWALFVRSFQGTCNLEMASCFVYFVKV